MNKRRVPCPSRVLCERAGFLGNHQDRESPALSLQNRRDKGQGTRRSKIRTKSWASPPWSAALASYDRLAKLLTSTQEEGRKET
jgi:hypothetical protein